MKEGDAAPPATLFWTPSTRGRCPLLRRYGKCLWFKYLTIVPARIQQVPQPVADEV